MGFLQNYTVAVTRTTTKTLFCEKCGKHIRYDVTRRARGYADRFFSPVDPNAAAHVLGRAVRKCEKKLFTAVNLVACTHCGWYQKHMVQQEKVKRFKGVVLLGIAMSFGLLFWQRFKPPIPLPASLPSFIQNYVAAIPLLLGLLLGSLWYTFYTPNHGQQNSQKAK
jgi:RNase P subunit RPR2